MEYSNRIETASLEFISISMKSFYKYLGEAQFDNRQTKTYLICLSEICLNINSRCCNKINGLFSLQKMYIFVAKLMLNENTEGNQSYIMHFHRNLQYL